jgi:sec-independent protein translocase protein TatA
MGIGIKELLIILIIIVLLFGTRKLKNIGTDLGSAIKGFRKSMNDEEDKQAAANLESQNAAGTTIDGKAEKVDEKK